ncbi:MAG: GAF domain-containing protein [Nitrospiraceae bacterium]|nr:MAG: GAF domain-containing protein [Nitrospiraceae bacterium]
MFNWLGKTYRQILDNMPDGVYVVDPGQRIQYWNRAAESLTGISADNATGRAFTEAGIKYEDEKGNPVQNFEYPAALCLQEKGPVGRNFHLITKDNGKIPVEENASPLYVKGKMEGVIVVVRDISHSIQAAELRMKNEKKERLIPICGWCKKIRSDENYWEQLETYLTKEGFGIFTHGMCPSCAEKIFEKKVYLESYQQICRAISASITLDEVLQLIVKNVVKVMNVKASLLRLLNRDTRQLELAAYYGLSKKYADKGPVKYDGSIDDALAGQTVSVYDIAEHQDSQYYKEAKEEGIRSILSIPLRFEKEVIGVLRMYTTEPVKYTEDDLKFITAIAEQGATAIVNARRFEKAVSREKEYLRAFEEITKAVGSTLHVNEVLNLIVKKIPQVMGLKGGSLRLLNRENKQLELAAYYGLSKKYADKGPVAYDASIDDAIAGKSVSVFEIAEHKDSKYYKEAQEEGIKSILSVPMRFQNEVTGVLRLYTDRPVRYNEEDLRFMEAIAEQTAIAIVNAKYFETALSREKEYLKVFQEVTKALSSTLHVSGVLDMIVRKIPEVMKLKAATIRLLDPTGKKLRLVAASGLSDKYLNRGPVDTEENIIEALNEKPVAIYDVTTDRRVRYQKEAAEEGIKSLLTLPIIARGKVLGILRLLTGEPRKFSQQEIDFAASLAEQSGIAIENATMYEKTKKEYDDMMQFVDGAFFEKE